MRVFQPDGSTSSFPRQIVPGPRAPRPARITRCKSTTLHRRRLRVCEAPMFPSLRKHRGVNRPRSTRTIAGPASRVSRYLRRSLSLSRSLALSLSLSRASVRQSVEPSVSPSARDPLVAPTSRGQSRASHSSPHVLPRKQSCSQWLSHSSDLPSGPLLSKEPTTCAKLRGKPPRAPHEATCLGLAGGRACRGAVSSTDTDRPRPHPGGCFHILSTDPVV